MSGGNGQRAGLPDGWQERKIGDVAEVIRGVTYKKPQASEHPGEDFLPLLRATNIGDELNFEGLIYIPDELVSDAQRLRKNDLVIASSSGSLKVVGKAAPLLDDWEGTFGAFCSVVRPGPDIAPTYLALYMRSRQYRDAVSALAAGTNINNLKRSHLLQLSIPVPPLDEQEHIVQRTGRLLHRIWSGLSDLATARDEVADYRSATIQAGLSGRLAAFDSQATASLGSASRTRLKDLASIQYGWTAKASDNRVGPRMLRITDIQRGAVDWDSVPYCEIPSEKQSKYLLQKGDIVFARSGATTGKSFWIEEDVPNAVYASYLIRVRVGKKLDPEFLSLIFQGADYWDYIRSNSRGMAQPNVNGTILGELEVPVPSLDAQRAAVATVNEQLAAVKQVEDEIGGARQRAERLAETVITGAVTGDLGYSEKRVSLLTARQR